MYTVMTVCTGNICRSPMAEIILRTEFERRGLADKVNVESSGVSDEEYGNPIDRRAVKVLREIRSIVVPSRCSVSVDMSCRHIISPIASPAM
ncbi:hypothetical protein KHP57_20220, partial [Algiphilus sp. NNCM1]|nr:hypothetical protein [Algiphilus acroporae]